MAVLSHICEVQVSFLRLSGFLGASDKFRASNAN